MATIKSFTSLEQSKVLAKILPLNTADMCYKCLGEDPYDTCLRPYSEWKEEYKGLLVNKEVDVIPCWSLASLLEAIPQEIFDGEYIINITEGWDNKWILTYDHHENRNHSYYTLSIGADNLVDACYEMILKLHELKML
jgi:hypothetical protein